MEKIIINKKQTEDSILVESEVDDLETGRFIECEWMTPAQIQKREEEYNDELAFINERFARE